MSGSWSPKLKVGHIQIRRQINTAYGNAFKATQVRGHDTEVLRQLLLTQVACYGSSLGIILESEITEYVLNKFAANETQPARNFMPKEKFIPESNVHGDALEDEKGDKAAGSNFHFDGEGKKEENDDDDDDGYDGDDDDDDDYNDDNDDEEDCY
ncbi:hypothetical protein GQX74_015650 [Glossina fuscipes]|nr:hypothetical protein GQX74_015650 [Glossina fuscipes]